MRDIIFRGKRIDNGEWVFGWYEPPVEWDGHKFGTTICYICEEGYLEDAEVDASTVGQYTGLTDKNGKRIFEGDILEGAGFDDEDGYGVVEWFDGAFEVANGAWCGTFHSNYNGFEFEVIGDIHDNPELVKEEPT